ncbi:signal peptidase I [Psychrobacillus sp. FSL W7-1457]|uniref:signal peptidase I n=1 Tax=unclassified Psychrobacillus TaxID=2636677 RepID=UPI0030FAF908
MKKKNGKNELREWIGAIGIAVLLAFGIRFFLFIPIEVEGASMLPTFENGDKVMVNKIGPKFNDYERFDVIVFKVNKDTNYIKRVIGLPGDHITYKDDELLINGKKYDEPYLDELKKELIDHGTLTQDFTLEDYLGEVVVPEGSLFVLGDNRRFSNDSREPSVGFISMDIVLGTVNMTYYPLNNFGFIK